MSGSFSSLDDLETPRKPLTLSKKKTIDNANNSKVFDEKKEDSAINFTQRIKFAKGKKLSHDFHYFFDKQKNIENKIPTFQTVKEIYHNSFSLTILLLSLFVLFDLINELEDDEIS